MYKQNLWCSHGRYVCVLRSVSLRMLRHSLHTHLNGLIQDVQSRYACSGRSSWKHLVTSFPCAGSYGRSPSWTFLTWRVILLMDGNVISHPSTVHSNRSGFSVCCVFTWDVTSPEFRTSSRIQDVYIDGFNFKCTVSTCFRSRFAAEFRIATIRAVFMNSVNVIFQMPHTLNALMQSSYGQIHGLMSRCTASYVSQLYHIWRFELTVRELAIMDLIMRDTISTSLVS
jgi:hypothetical protein